jgi:hypothetical protein
MEESSMSLYLVDKIRDIGFDMRDNYMDGFTQFGAKKKLYQILWETQKQLENAPTFVGEEEWLKENGR